MNAVAERYTELVQRGQQVAVESAQAWTKAVQEGFTALPVDPAGTDFNAVIDHAYDFGAKQLELLRDFTKNYLATAATAAETVAKVPPVAAARKKV